MAFRYRSDIAGKRFLAVKRGVKLKLKDYQNWDWQSGVIRATSDRDYFDPEVTILAEFHSQDWKKRKVIRIQEEYQLFLVEKTLVKVDSDSEETDVQNKKDTFIALSFEAIIGSTLLSKLVHVPVVSLVGHHLVFVKGSSLAHHQEGEVHEQSAEELGAVQQWYEYQESQQLFLQTPTVLVGYRVRVYRSEGTTQWYTAVIQSYNEKTQELVVTDDTVLEEHREDPALLEIHLLGDRVLESILRGDDVRVRPSRTCRTQDNGNKSSTRRRSTNSRRSCPEKVVEALNKVKKSEKDVKRKSAPCLPKNVDTENKTSTGSLGSRTLSKRAKSQEKFEVTLRNTDNRTPTKSLIVPLLDISPKKFRDRRDSCRSSLDKGDKVIFHCETKSVSKSVSKPADSDSSCVGIPRIHSAKGKTCDRDGTSPTKKRTKQVTTAKLSNSAKLKPDVDGTNQQSIEEVDQLINKGICPGGKSPDKKKQFKTPVKSNPSQSSAVKKQKTDKNQGSPSAQKSNIACDSEKKKPGSVSRKEKKGLPATPLQPVESKSIVSATTPVLSQYHNNKAVVVQSRGEKQAALLSEARLITQECSTGGRHHQQQQDNSSDQDFVGSSTSRNNSCKVEQKPTSQLQHSLQKLTESSRPHVVVYSSCASKTGQRTSSLLSDSTVVKTEAIVKTSSIDLSAPLIIQGNLSSCNNRDTARTTTKCTPKGEASAIVGESCSGVETKSSCEAGKVNLHSQECTHSAHVSSLPSTITGTSTTTTEATAVLPHGPNYIPVFAETLAEENNKDMYFKKTLLGDYQRKESGGHTSPQKGGEQSEKSSGLSTTGINLNQSLTDQLARRAAAKSEHHRSWEDVMKSTSSNGLDLPSKVSDLNSSLSADVRVSPSVSSSVSERKPDPRVLEGLYHPGVHTERSRLDEPGPHSNKSVEPKAGTSGPSLHRDLRTEDRTNKEREVGKTSNSPLLVDKARPVEPYRDPELLKKDEFLRKQAIQKQQVHVPLTHQSMNPPPNVPGHPSSHAAAHPMLSHMTAAAAAAAAGGVPTLPSQLAAIQEQAFAAQINYLRSLAIHQQSALTPLTFTGIQNPYQTRQLEMLWQQKFPNIQVPPGWLLHQYQDELLRDVSHVTPNLLQHRDILDREREMRDRELALERDRMDREMREREERERAVERERLERERQDRERQERERLERERRDREERIEHEKRERERQDRERREKERQQEQQRERERREILHESKAAADAVEKHFQESLNRLNQRHALSTGTWFPGGGPPTNNKPSPLQSLSNPKSYPPCTSAFSSVSMGGGGGKPLPPHSTMPPTTGIDRKLEEKPKLPDYVLPSHGHPHPGMRANHSPSDTKPKLSPQDLSHKPSASSSWSEQDTKPSITLRESLIKGFPSEPVNLRAENKIFPGYPGQPPLKETTAATTSASGHLSMAGHQIKQEPNFSLYGYPYQQTNPVYISQDKLVQGLKEEKGIKQEPTDLRKPPLNSPPPLVKTEQKPVVSESKPDVRLQSGHSHGSITLGTSRGQTMLPQQDSKSGLIVANSSAAQNSPMRVSSPQQLLQSMKAGYIPMSTAAQTSQALSMAMQQAYIVAMAQNSMGTMSAPQDRTLVNHNKDKRPQLSPNSKKRQAQQRETAVGQDKKKTKVDPNGAPPATSGSKPAPGTYIDSFKSFVENAVHINFFQDGDVAERMRLNPQFKQQFATPPKPYDTPQQLNKPPQKQLSPSKEMTLSGSSSAPALNSVMTGTTATSAIAIEETKKPQSHTPFVPHSQPLPTLTTGQTTGQSITSSLAKGSSSTTSATNHIGNLGIPSHPGPASTPGSLSSSISSIQETINRVANGTMDTDSDTLSAPSPPPMLKSSTDAPSPVRLSNPSKPSFKKAILARYSGDSVPHCENSNSSLCDHSPPKIDKHEKMDITTAATSQTGVSSNEGCTVKSDSLSSTKPPPPQLPLKTPLESLKEADKEEMTTSASEAEQQDGDSKSQSSGKGKKKTSKRKSEGLPAGSSSKKQKALANVAASNSDAESGTNTEVSTKKKKKNGKNKSETNDNTKAKSPDVKQEIEVTEPANSSDIQMSSNNNKTKPTKDTNSSTEPTSQTNTPTGPNTTLSGGASILSTVSTVSSSSSSSTVLSSISMGMSKTPSMMEVERSDVKKVDDKSSEVARPKKSMWDCEKKLKELEKKQAQREKEVGKKGKKGDKSAEKASAASSGSSASKGDSGQNEEGSKDDNPSSILANKPLNKDPVNKLKKNQEPFLQDASCGEIAPKLMKCRECKMRNKKLPNIFCRFYAFRRLKYNPKGCVSIAGFSEPSDADVDDIELWYPRFPPISPALDLDMAKYVMANLGDRFCELVEQEKEAMMWVSADSKIVWKRAVQGVREMCDVCDTTLFNMHWCCHKCGFVVCIDCYRNKAKKTGSNQDKSCKINEEATNNQKWLTCSANRQQHEPDKLKITQIIPSDVLWALGCMIHDVRDSWGMQSNCPCGHTSKVNPAVLSSKNGMSQHVFTSAMNQCLNNPGLELKDRPLVNGIGGSNSKKKPLSNSLLDSNSLNGSPLMSPLNILAEAAASRESETKKDDAESTGSNKETGGSGDNNKMCSTLRDLLTRHGAAPGVKPPTSKNEDNSKKPKGISGLGNILQEVVDKTQKSEDGSNPHHHHHQTIKTLQLSHYKPRSGSQMQGRSSPIPVYTLKETSVLFPDITHSWLDHGRLLRLHNARCSQNMQLFQQQWRRGQPVIVSHCDKFLNTDIWTPKAFSKEFGELENDLVNCSTGVTMLGHKMKVFWDGFQRTGARLKDGKNRPLILKLKDWPPTEDFSDLMPSRFQDLMQALPLPEYTQRTGTFNLASRLPEFFVKPDLGPKMYNAYGSAMQPKTGSTNLHLDMSDAVNLMIYVGIPEDDKEAQEKAAMETMEEAQCCEFTKERARGGEKPGALWHIFDALDADKIRDLLNKVAVERGEKIDLNHDPIHDQAWYLNTELRERLLNEYGVQGYSIVQYLGDAVFIPAGAPHQVKNLHSCIKAAEDFVSPENINHCFKMTQEFRYLSETHSNHEDKLQIKNIIYHAVKDAVAVLKRNDPTAENSTPR